MWVPRHWHASAQDNLGRMYANGWGVKQSHAEAATWLGKAADQGNGRAQVNLGLMYENGWGVKQSHAEAAKWFGKAADQCELCEALLLVFVLFFLQDYWVFRLVSILNRACQSPCKSPSRLAGAWVPISLLLASCFLLKGDWYNLVLGAWCARLLDLPTPLVLRYLFFISLFG
jgi:hypothetical protein